MNALLSSVSAALARLSPRERRLVGILGAAFAFVLAWTLVVEPLTGGRRRLQARVESLSSEIDVLSAKAAQIHRLEAIGAGSGSTNAAASPDFSLFAFIDKVAGGAVQRDRVASMVPSRRTTEDGVEEAAVELKLSAVTLEEAVQVLKGIETAKEPVFVKRMDMRKRYDNAAAFDVTIVAGALVSS